MIYKLYNFVYFRFESKCFTQLITCLTQLSQLSSRPENIMAAVETKPLMGRGGGGGGRGGMMRGGGGRGGAGGGGPGSGGSGRGGPGGRGRKRFFYKCI